MVMVTTCTTPRTMASEKSAAGSALNELIASSTNGFALLQRFAVVPEHSMNASVEPSIVTTFAFATSRRSTCGRVVSDAAFVVGVGAGVGAAVVVVVVVIGGVEPRASRIAGVSAVKVNSNSSYSPSVLRDFNLIS